MIFNSLTFICFFIIVHLVYALPLSWEKRKIHLWLSSYIFYAAWNPPFVLLLWISTLIDWFAGKNIARTSSRHKKRILLLISLATNLGLLGYFKYGTFLLESFVSLSEAVGIHYQPAVSHIVLPVGISFYTFQSLSYSLDIYRGKLKPWPKFTDFAFFVTFFPQLVAGPIVRAADFLPQCRVSRRATSYQMGWGLTLLVLGLFEKVILADTIMAPVADMVFSNSDLSGTADAWLGVFAFSGQVFFDFSGYSLCAIGAALSLGFVLPDNFRFPYAAVGFSDFWRRWHISLSSWLRDYLYIPLGGNRKGELRTYINLMITMLLGGLWHGAAWTFVAWGGLHGLYLSVERYLLKHLGDVEFFRKRIVQGMLGLLTFILVSITYVFFRAQDFPDAFHLLTLMFSTGELQLLSFSQSLQVAVTLGLLLVGQWLLRDSSLEALATAVPPAVRVVLIAGALVTLSLHRGGDRAFIYFQF
ncbi:MBOAT family O-acyltransferase [Desulfopila inferna]|uniref:MBOAT family O-acyltransferase n=1 Tax=Desulfopila inferna TaxID=468528 RepID=UPI0019654CD8|nr:MBOAT family protein [Desulfopila inferna]MBM9606493.1 MBOAT family protein [Desulfopila inferna]